jgi:WD40 repeat protein
MDGALHVRDLDTGVDRDLLEGVPETARVKLNRVIIDAEGRRVAAGGRDGIVRIWDLGSGKLLRKLEDLKGKRIGGLDFSPSNRWIAATDDHGWLALWPLDSVGSPCLVHLSHQELFAAAFDETESFIAAAGADRVVLVWPLHQPDARPRELFGHQDMVGDVKFGPGGVLASASDDGTIIIWDVGKQAIIKRLKAHPGGVWDIAFDSSRRWMATAGQDRKARIWDTESWEQVGANQERERVCGVAFGPRAEYVVFGGSSRVVKRWDIRDALANAPGAAKSSRREAATPADRR